MFKCTHSNWEVVDSNRVGTARCNDCGESVNLDVLFNALKKDMESTQEACTRVRIACVEAMKACTETCLLEIKNAKNPLREVNNIQPC